MDSPVAKPCTTAEGGSVDQSVLKLPIRTGISDINQIIRSIHSGTPEVRDLLINECEIVYECRACRSLFRSLANFLFHKRQYCKKHFCENLMAFTSEDVPQEIIVVQPKSPEKDTMEEEESSTSEAKEIEEDSNLSVGVVTTKICQLTPKIEQRKIGCSIAASLSHNADKTFPAAGSKCAAVSILKDTVKSKVDKSIVTLNRIETNPNAVFQSVKNVSTGSDLNKEQNDKPMTMAEVREKIEAAQTAVVHVDVHTIRKPHHESDQATSVLSRLKERNDCDVNSLLCNICKTQYMSLKTLDFHMRTIHSDYRLYYPCPYCKTAFVQLWGVTRHMVSIHKKSKEQVNRLREIVRKRAFRKNPLPKPKSVKQQPKPSPTSSKTPEKGVSDNGVKRKLENEVKTEIKETIVNQGEKIFPCGKCKREFTKKSSQINHEKHCIHTSTVVSNEPPPKELKEEPKISPPSSVAATEKDVALEVNTRPKRNAKKKKDDSFVDFSEIGYSRMMAKQPVQCSSKQMPSVVEKKMMSIVNLKRLQCLKCCRRFSSFSNLRRHAAIHIGFNRFKCDECGYQAYNRSDCRNHVQRIHFGNKGSESAVDKLIIDITSAPVRIKKDDLPAPASPRQPPLENRMFKSATNAVMSSTIKIVYAKANQVGATTYTKHISNQDITNNSAKSDSPSSSSSNVSSSPVGRRLPVRQISRSSCGSEKGAGDESLRTLVTRSGKYPKLDLISKYLQDKASDSKAGSRRNLFSEDKSKELTSTTSQSTSLNATFDRGSQPSDNTAASSSSRSFSENGNCSSKSNSRNVGDSSSDGF